MKKLILCLLAILNLGLLWADENILRLPAPNISEGLPLMQAFAQRASAPGTAFSKGEFSLQELSDLLWAANGVNRPSEGKRTAASAMNSQDVDVFVFLEDGVYLYMAEKHQLKRVAEGDHRLLTAGRQEQFAQAPLVFLLVSDTARFARGDHEQKQQWAALDAGMVAQNIMLLCASEGWLCRPRASMDKDRIAEVLGLTDLQIVLLNIPVAKNTMD